MSDSLNQMMKTITKLTCELVPKPLWRLNLRTKMGRRQWDVLRKQVYAAHDHKCGICEYDGRLNCHEIWDYDDEKHIQRLDGFTALCNLCHHIKHLGKAQLLVREGKLDRDLLVNHFVEVNECEVSDYNEYIPTVFDQYIERSAHKWTVDFGDYENLLEVKC